jgi:hypothetical protein
MVLKGIKMTVEQILELLRAARDDWENPGSYMDSEWYDKCAASASALTAVIDTIEYRIREANAVEIETSAEVN